MNKEGLKEFIKGLKEIVNICEKYNIEMWACECCSAISFESTKDEDIGICDIQSVDDLKLKIKDLEILGGTDETV